MWPQYQNNSNMKFTNILSPWVALVLKRQKRTFSKKTMQTSSKISSRSRWQKRLWRWQKTTAHLSDFEFYLNTRLTACSPTVNTWLMIPKQHTIFFLLLVYTKWCLVLQIFIWHWIVFNFLFDKLEQIISHILSLSTYI